MVHYRLERVAVGLDVADKLREEVPERRTFVTRGSALGEFDSDDRASQVVVQIDA
ncbi:MAG: hypothetical protein M3331_05575 [Actinomycetota bacterium]|nr:hypothetical protein [Actinomycetota bacterium]